MTTLRRVAAFLSAIALVPLVAVVAPPLAVAAPARPGKPGAKPKAQIHHAARPPVGPLPFLPTIARVTVDGSGERILVTEDVRLPRGEWNGGDLDFYVAFGAPAAPLAVDVHLYSPTGEETTASLTRSPTCPRSVHPLLGPRDMSGVIAHVPAAAFMRATTGGEAILRVRTVLAPIRPDGNGGREAPVRLGDADDGPIAVERIGLGPGLGAVNDASAHLCGEDADPYPLALGTPRVRLRYPRPEAPWLARRAASDNLCIRWVR